MGRASQPPASPHLHQATLKHINHAESLSKNTPPPPLTRKGIYAERPSTSTECMAVCNGRGTEHHIPCEWNAAFHHHLKQIVHSMPKCPASKERRRRRKRSLKTKKTDRRARENHLSNGKTDRTTPTEDLTQSSLRGERGRRLGIEP